MKFLKLCSLAAISALLVLTSCLGESDTTQNLYDIPGVIKWQGDRNVAVTPFFVISMSDLDKFMTGDCVWVSFAYDSKTAGDENANGYSLVTPIKATTRLDEGRLIWNKTDTATLMLNEIEVDHGIGSYDYNFYSYIEGYMFLASAFTGLTDQRNSWELYYDVDQTPKVGASSQGEDINIYTLYMRAKVVQPGKTPEKSDFNLNTYQIKSLVDRLNEKEKAIGKKAYGVNVRFLNKISKDSTELTWKDSTYPILFEVSKEN